MIRPTVIATLPKMPAGWTWSQPSAGRWAPVDASLMQRLRPSEFLPPQQEPRAGARISWPGVGELFYLPAVLGPWQYRADGHPGYERRDVRGGIAALRTKTIGAPWWWEIVHPSGFADTYGPYAAERAAQGQAELKGYNNGWLLLDWHPVSGLGPFTGEMLYGPKSMTWLLKDQHSNTLASGLGGGSVALNYIHAAIELLGYEVPA